MREPLVSVIVPIYKVEPYLKKCLDSIVNQTYRNLEIILVDDGSPDGCGAICERYKAENERIIVIHQENQGLSMARNAGLDICQGEYIAFVDSDDWVEPQYIEAMLEHANEDTIVCCGVNVHKDGDSHIDLYNGKLELVGKELLCSYFEYRKNTRRTGPHLPISHSMWNKLYPRRLFAQVRFLKGINYEDLWIYLFLLIQVNKMRIVDMGLYNYRVRAGSITQTPTKKNLMNNLEAHLEQEHQVQELDIYHKCARENTLKVALSVVTLVNDEFNLEERQKIKDIINERKELINNFKTFIAFQLLEYPAVLKFAYKVYKIYRGISVKVRNLIIQN